MRPARCSECGRPDGQVRAFIRLRRGLLCDVCVASAVGTLRMAGIDLTRLCPQCHASTERTMSRDPRSAAEHLAELRRRVGAPAKSRANERVGMARRLWLQHALCVLCARAVRVAARHWRDGRDSREGPTLGMPWRTVWSRWMVAAESQRALAKWHYAAMRTTGRRQRVR